MVTHELLIMTIEDKQPVLGDRDSSDDTSQDPPAMRKRIRIIRDYVTVEPVIALYVIYKISLTFLSTQFIFAQIAESKNYTQKQADGSICDSNETKSEYAQIQDIQQKSSYYSLVITSTSMFPAIFSSIFLGSYSDTRGRKPAILVPLAGALLRCLFYLIVIGFRLSLWFLVIGSLLEGLSGGSTALLMGCFSYIGDVTPHKSRTFRVVVVEGVIKLSSVICDLSIGYVIERVGFLYPFIFLFVFTLLNVAYILILLPETNSKTDSKTKFFQFGHLKSVFRLFLKDNGSNRRWKIQLCLLITVVNGLPTAGMNDSVTYFLKGSPLCFTSVQLGWFTANFDAAHVVGGLLAIRFLGPHVGDEGLLIMASISGMGFLLIFAATQTIWMLVLVVLVSMMAYMTIGLARGFMSKLAQPDEQGALFAGIAVIETLKNTVAVMTFNAVYSATLNVMPGFVFVVMAAMFAIGIVLSSILFILNTRPPTKKDIGIN